MSRRGPGEGAIFPRADGRWCAYVTTAMGKRKYLYGRTRREVAQKLTGALRAHDAGLPLPKERETVGHYLADWIEGMRSKVRASTWKRYSELMRLHAVPGIGRVPLGRLSPQHLDRLYADRLSAGLSPTTVHHLHAVLHKALDQAMRWNLTPRNVADLVDAPRIVRNEMRALSVEQVRALLTAARGERLEALYVLAVTTGMRQGELLALRWHDVDLDAGSLAVTATVQATVDGRRLGPPKTSRSRRRVELTEPMVANLRRHRVAQAEERLRLGSEWKNNDLVFANRRGGFVDVSDLTRSFRTVLTTAELPRIRFHDLRHTAATLMLGQGVHPKIASDMLGHATVSITLDTYSHVTPTMQRHAVRVFDQLFTHEGVSEGVNPSGPD